MLVDSPPVTISRRYRLEETLGAGGMGAVFQVHDRLTNTRVALKRVLAAGRDLVFTSSHPSVDLRLALAQEFQWLAGLKHPNIITVLDYGFDSEQQPFFTMELLSKAQTIREAAHNQPLEVQVSLLVQVLYALSYLHRRNIVHRDLKPANVLVVNNHVKVLDFGLSVRTAQTSDSSGTLAYMAPEVLMGDSTTISSDLYSLGIVAYEMITGKHPFDTTSITRLTQQIMSEMPDLTLIDIESPLRSIVARLLAKLPEDRYANAGEVISAINTMAGQNFPIETQEIRESFLQSIPLTGRDVEIEQLLSAMSALSEKKGSAWLIGGESGIGKSRLLDELRTQALVRGTTVIRGQSLSAGSSPFEVWRNVLHWLILLLDVTDQEAAALKPLIPDISSLVERDIPDAAPLDSKAAQLRLFTVTGSLLRKIETPTIIILEDLQWAGDESIDMLRWVLRDVRQLPIQIIGSYRDDERPQLPTHLAEMQSIKLKRLSTGDISHIAETMLGATGSQPEVVTLLNRETEGNVYFLIEVVRALAEEAGQIDKIGAVTLPAHVFSGGIRKIVQRRLQQIPADLRPLLDLAAIIGRQLDEKILRAAAPTIDMEHWLTICVNAAVLDASEGHWRFAHDKLREEVLATLDPVRRSALNKQVAMAIESVYPDDRSQLVALAEHWAAADEPEKASHYAALAGEEALRNGANYQAIEFFGRALAKGTHLPDVAKGHLEKQIGEAYLALGRLTDCRLHYTRALELLGYPELKTRGQWVRTLLTQLMRQIKHRLMPAKPITDAAKVTEILDASSAWERIGELNYYTNDTLGTVTSGIFAINLADKAPTSALLARTTANMAIIGGVIPLHRMARSYGKRAVGMINNLDDPGLRAFVLGRISVYRTGAGQWSAERDLRESAQIAQQVGFHRQWGESMSILGLSVYFQGRFAESAALYDELYDGSVRTDDIHNQARGLYWSAQARIRLGQLDEAIALLEKSQALLAKYGESAEHGWIVITHGLLALAHIYRGENLQAMPLLKLVTAASITSFAIMEGYASAAEAKLALWEASNDAATWAQSAQESLTTMKKYARVFAVGCPRYWLYQGRMLWLSGKHEAAQKAWEKSLSFAQSLHMPFEEGLALYDLGRHAANEADKTTYLTRARALFSTLGAAYDLSRVQVALSSAKENA